MAGPSGWGVSQSKQRTLFHRELQRAFSALRPAESRYSRSSFTALGACATQGTGRETADRDLVEYYGAALVAYRESLERDDGDALRRVSKARPCSPSSYVVAS